MKNNNPKKIKFKLKTLKPIVFIIILLFLGVISVTLALFYNRVTVVNKFKSMTYNVELEEEFYNKWGTKKVTIINKEETNTPVVVRISYSELWSKKSDSDVLLTLNNGLNGINVVDKAWTNSFTDDFVLGNDGWYYYKKLLGSNESVQILESINLKEDLIKDSLYYEEYLSYDYELTFNYEAIQATSEAVKEIWGIDININGDNITWNF